MNYRVLGGIFFACGAYYKANYPYYCSIYLKIFACGAYYKDKFLY